MKRTFVFAGTIGIIALVLSAGAAAAQAPAKASTAGADWPRWRGPDADGISRDTRWNPAALAAAKPLWKVNVGKGYSSVTVKGQRLFTMGFQDGQDTVHCLDARTGAGIWKRSYACGSVDHPGPRATPTLDNGLVYTISCQGHILCLKEADGSIAWQKNALADFEARNVKWGFSGSAFVEDRLVFFNAGPGGLALDKKTGAKVWSSGPGVGGYSTPVAYTLGGKRRLALFVEKAACGVDLQTGERLWSHPWTTSYDVNAADPIVADSEVFITSGYRRGCALLDLSGAAPRVVYENKTLQSHFSSPVLIGGHLYGIDGNTGKGDLVCLEFKTGAEKWRKNLGFGSLMAVGDKLLVLNEGGRLFVADASPAGYREVAAGPSGIGATCWTVPVFCRGLVYCRNDKGDLAALDLGGDAPSAH